MNDKPPIPLNYARPAGPADESRATPAPPRPTAARGTLPPDQATAAILDTPDRANMAFAARALDQRRIPYRIVELPAPAGSYAGPLRLLVRPADADPAAAIAQQTVARRERLKKLAPPPSRNDEPFTWPDPLPPLDLL